MEADIRKPLEKPRKSQHVSYTTNDGALAIVILPEGLSADDVNKIIGFSAYAVARWYESHEGEDWQEALRTIIWEETDTFLDDNSRNVDRTTLEPVRAAIFALAKTEFVDETGG